VRDILRSPTTSNVKFAGLGCGGVDDIDLISQSDTDLSMADRVRGESLRVRVCVCVCVSIRVLCVADE
jgi:hypothetical protein